MLKLVLSINVVFGIIGLDGDKIFYLGNNNDGVAGHTSVISTVKHDTTDEHRCLGYCLHKDGCESVNVEILEKDKQFRCHLFGGCLNEYKGFNTEFPSRYYSTKNNKDCALFFAGQKTDGVYKISPNGAISFEVYCDMTNGGWIVFHRNFNGTTSFDKDWVDYKKGFGSLHSDFWLGNDYLSLLTKDCNYELQIDMTVSGNNISWLYKKFCVGTENNNYTLTVKDFHGSGSESFSSHNGRPFTTRDRNNDYTEGVENCAIYYKGGWWFDNCRKCFLNSLSKSSCDIGNINEIKNDVTKTVMKLRKLC